MSRKRKRPEPAEPEPPKSPYVHRPRQIWVEYFSEGRPVIYLSQEEVRAALEEAQRPLILVEYRWDELAKHTLETSPRVVTEFYDPDDYEESFPPGQKPDDDEEDRARDPHDSIHSEEDDPESAALARAAMRARRIDNDGGDDPEERDEDEDDD